MATTPRWLREHRLRADEKRRYPARVVTAADLNTDVRDGTAWLRDWSRP